MADAKHQETSANPTGSTDNENGRTETALPRLDAPGLETDLATETGSRRPQSSELRPGPGFRVRLAVDRVPAETLARLAAFETTDISDALNRMFTMKADIRNLVNDRPLCGPALTVKAFPGDNLMVHKALDAARPGDVVVVDTSGRPNNAVLGDLIGNKARHRGIAGFIVDGLIRDLDGLREVGLPVYAAGVTSFGPLHRGPGELGYSVSCGGIVVNPGDAICADASGIVVVRREFAAETADHLEQRREAMADYIANVKKGIFSNDWVDRTLSNENCIFE